MFPRRERLSRAQFPTALKGGKRLTSEHFSVIFPADTRGYAVVIPKKVLRLASARHNLKRRIIAALQELPLPTALIIFPKAGAYGVHYRDMKAELSGLLAQTKHNRP